MSRSLTATFSREFKTGARIQIENFAAPETGVTVVFGPSGAGKSTLLRCIAGIERPDSGTIRFGEQCWFDSSKKICLSSQARNVGFVPQQYGLFPHLSVLRNVEYGIRDLSP